MYEMTVEQIANEIIRVAGLVNTLNELVHRYDVEIAKGDIARTRRREAWRELNQLQQELSELQDQQRKAQLMELVEHMPSIHLYQVAARKKG